MSSVDVSAWPSRNMWPLADGSPAVRPGLRGIYDAVAGRTIVAGFSVVEPNTLEGWHYVVDVDSTTSNNCVIRVYDENFVLLQAYDTGSDVVPEVVTFGTALDFLVISSPSFPTAFGFVGGGLVKALKQNSVNTGTTAIDVPQGLCAGWAGRIAYASGSALFFSDPVTLTGGDPRTVVGENQLDLGSTIRGLHVNAGGALVAVTESGVYALSEQAAAVGQIVFGDVQRLTDYEATRFGVTCSSFGRVFGLTSDGFRLVDSEGAQEVELDDPVMPVGHGERIQCAEYSSMCRIYSGTRGPIVSYPRHKAAHLVDRARGFHSWWTMTDDGTNETVGALRERDGTELLLTKSGAFRVEGNFDGDAALTENGTAVKGFFLGRLPSPVEGSPVVRRVDVSSDTGSTVLAAVRGEDKSTATTQRGAVIGTAAWSVDAVSEAPLQSARFHYSNRTDDIAIEAGASLPLSRVDPRVSVEVRGPGEEGAPVTIGDSQTIEAADLNSEADSRRTTIDAVRQDSAGLRVSVINYDFSTGGEAITRQVLFTPQDNYELVSLWVYVDNVNGGETSTVTLAVASGETAYILDDSVSLTLTHAGSGPESATQDHADTAATRYVLRKGVAYSLTLSGSDTATIFQGVATFKVKRRTA